MERFAALLRGVSPMNAKMPQLKRAFEEAGYTEVKTVLSSGNVIFGARASSLATLERKVEAAMSESLDRTFPTIVRPLEALRALLERDPYRDFRFPSDAKRVVTFLRKPHPAKLTFPIEFDGAQILGMEEGEVFSAYVPSASGPSFMNLLEKTFGKDITTRTWDTVRKVAADPPAKASKAKAGRTRR